MELRKLKALYVGRGRENDLDLNDRRLSRRHCRFFREGDALYVEDLGSMNGTLVNGATIHRRQRLQDRDVIQVGTYHFRVKGHFIMAGYHRRIVLEGDATAA